MRLLSSVSGGAFKWLFILLIFGIAGFTLNSCGRCAGCSERGGLAFYNFSRTEMDSIVIREYVAGTNFTSLKQSIAVAIITARDTAPYAFEINIPDNIDSPQCDILVYIPSDSLTYKITNITTTPKHCRCPEIPLYSFTGCKVNSVSSVPYNPDGIIGGYLSITK